MNINNDSNNKDRNNTGGFIRKIFSKPFRYSTDMFVRTFICSYFIVSTVNLLIHANDEADYNKLDFLQKDASGADFLLHCLLILGIMLFLTALEYFLPKWKTTPHLMVIFALLMSFILLLRCESSVYYMYFAVLFICAMVILYSTDKECFSFIKSDFHSAYMWTAVGFFALVFGFFVTAIGVYRYLSYSTPNFDFGIFCNMFYNMKETGLPNSTSERDMLLSHFAVHFSPVYYLMLPFYFIFPSPSTLQVLQAVVLYSGIIPLVLTARKLGLSKKLTVAVSAVYAAYPALSAGCFYDLHENCFLVPLLLWTFYFFEKEKYIPMAVFALLTLTVKEDAFIYLVFFALYVIFSRKKWKIGLPMLCLSLIYFVTVSYFMQKYGTGIMSGRFGNLIFDSEDGLIGALKTLLLNPGYVLTQIFTTSSGNTDKLLYLLQLFLPLAFLPFATKKVSRFILICPVLLNILTMYVYQPNINFQYSFGITAFLFYVSMLNLSELPHFSKKYMIQVGAAASVLLFTVVVIPKFTHYAGMYTSNKAIYEKMDYALEEVLPENASVTCSTFLLAHIADRDVIYEVGYHTENGQYKTDTEFVVLDMRSGYRSSSLKQAEYFISKGYVEFYSDEETVLILRNESMG